MGVPVFHPFSLPSPVTKHPASLSPRFQDVQCARGAVQNPTQERGDWGWDSRQIPQGHADQLAKVVPAQSPGMLLSLNWRSHPSPARPQLPGLEARVGLRGAGSAKTYQVDGGLQEEKHVPARSLHPPASQTSSTVPSLSLCSFRNIDPPDIHFTEQGALSAA